MGRICNCCEKEGKWKCVFDKKGWEKCFSQKKYSIIQLVEISKIKGNTEFIYLCHTQKEIHIRFFSKDDYICLYSLYIDSISSTTELFLLNLLVVFDSFLPTIMMLLTNFLNYPGWKLKFLSISHEFSCWIKIKIKTFINNLS